MTKQEERYLAWSNALFGGLLDGDVDAQVALWAEDCTHTEIDAFGEHHTVQGRAAIRKLAEDWVTWKNFRVLKDEVLIASEEKGVGNAVVRWTSSDGKEMSCDHIYMITLDSDDRCVSYTEWNVVRAKEE